MKPNPFDLDFTAIAPEVLEERRHDARRTPSEAAAHPTRSQPWPTRSQWAARLGISHDHYYSVLSGASELVGVRAALARLHLDEGRVVTPTRATLDELDALWRICEQSWTTLAAALGQASRATPHYWRYGCGYVPGGHGAGRLVRICYEDCVGPPPASGGAPFLHALGVGSALVVDAPLAVDVLLLRTDVAAQAATLLVDARGRLGVVASGLRVSLARGGASVEIPHTSGLRVALAGNHPLTPRRAVLVIDAPAHLRMILGQTRR